MSNRWLESSVVYACLKAWVDEGRPEEIWPVMMYDDNGEQHYFFTPADILDVTINPPREFMGYVKEEGED